MEDGLVSGGLSHDDLGRAADLLTDAFFDNPAHVHIYPEAAKRRSQLRWLMSVNLGAQLAVGRSFGMRGPDGEIVAMAFWHAPGAPKATPGVLFRFGFFAMPVRHGWGSFSRMLKSVQEMESRRAEGLRGRESWYLNNMVVSPAHRGRGVGRRVLKDQLEQVVDPSGQPASLTTQKPENVSFYRQLGFEVVDEGVVGHGPHAFRNWIMTYG